MARLLRETGPGDPTRAHVVVVGSGSAGRAVAARRVDRLPGALAAAPMRRAV